MKRLVGAASLEDAILGAAAVLLAAIVAAEAAISYLIVFGLLAIAIGRDRNRRRRAKQGAHRQTLPR